MTKLDFADWFKDKRLSRGLTQQQLADLMGCSRPTINAIENKRQIATKPFIISAAYVFNIDIDQLLNFAQGHDSDLSAAKVNGPISSKIAQMVDTLPVDQQELVLKIAELAINGYGNEKAALGRASPKQKAETQPT